MVSALLAGNLQASTLYVSLQSTNPTPPYATWNTAANVIQDAVNAARSRDLILVADGEYSVGQMWCSKGGWSRVEVTNSIVLRSINGPSHTIIDGQPSRSPFMRCVYLGNSSVLDGFKLLVGSASYGGGGGVMSEPTGVITNCIFERCYGGGFPGGGLLGGTAYSCVFSENTTWHGGGAARSTLYNCTLSGNSATIGGGAWQSTLFNCRLIQNRSSAGGGANDSTLVNCILSGNQADEEGYEGGATVGGVLYNCTLTANVSSLDSGGCAVGGALVNCIVNGNSNGNYRYKLCLQVILTPMFLAVRRAAQALQGMAADGRSILVPGVFVRSATTTGLAAPK